MYVQDTVLSISKPRNLRWETSTVSLVLQEIKVLLGVWVYISVSNLQDACAIPLVFFVYRCDCVGILKERNVDVEHRFPDQSGSRNKKKSTRCRMVFRTTITHPDGTTEALQTTSQPIVCSKLDILPAS
jgi:hypothetical protein